MAITILNPSATSNLSIDAPATSKSISTYLISAIADNDLTDTPEILSISQSTTETGINLTSFGKVSTETDGLDGTAWRLRNGTSADISVTFDAYGSDFSTTYELPANTDTFVISPIFAGTATHRLISEDATKVKAASDSDFQLESYINNSEAYTVVSGIGHDSLTGGDGKDTLIGGSARDVLTGGRRGDSLYGKAGRDLLVGEVGNDRLFGGGRNDTLEGGEKNDLLVGQGDDDVLTGGSGQDRFRFTNSGVDEVTDFSLTDGDIFQLASSVYENAPLSRTTPVVGDTDSDSVNIYVDTSSSLGMVTSSEVHFAYATDSLQLLYDADGDWSTGNVIVANTNDFGIPTSENFDFH